MARRHSRLFALAAAVAFVGLSQVALGGTVRIIYGNYFGPTHPNTKAMEFFKEMVEKESNGDFKVTLKPNNEIGGEEKLQEMVKRGTIQIAMVGGYLKDDEPMIAAFEQPFIVDGWDHARKIYFDPGIKKFQGKFTEKTGGIIAGYVVNGFRQVSCRFEISSMDDFKKMKIRTPMSEVFHILFAALGTSPTPMPMTELYTAMETKVVDGQDNPYSTVKAMGWWEVQPFMLESRHIFSPTSVVVNGKFYNGLSPEHKAIFDKAMAESIKYDWDISAKDEQESIDFLKSKGIKIVIPDDTFKKQMREASKAVYDWFDKSIPGSKEFRDYCDSLK